MTEIEFVRQHFPSASETEARSLLWECTAYPFCTIEHAGRQLAGYATKMNTPAGAVWMAHEEMMREWEEDREEREREMAHD